MKPQKILMPTDFSPCAEAALDHAIYLAEQFDAELHLLHIVFLHGDSPRDLGSAFPDIEDLHRHLESIAASEMGRLLGERKVGMLKVREVCRRSISPAPAITDYVAEEGIDLVVLGTHGRRGLRRFFLGSVAEEVVRTAGCPVITIHGREGKTSVKPVERILVPYDFSPESERALDEAIDLAEAHGAQKIDLLHVLAPPIAPGVFAADVPLPASYRTDLVSAVRDGLERKAGQFALPVTAHVRQGPAALEIVDFAKEAQTNLIVLGSHGLTGLTRFLLGSVSERVVRAAECPVLVLRGQEETTDSE